jgi:hypothetical protein
MVLVLVPHATRTGADARRVLCVLTPSRLILEGDFGPLTRKQRQGSRSSQIAPFASRLASPRPFFPF